VRATPAGRAEAPAAATPALVLADLHKSFGQLEVLRGIDLLVAQHEVVCLIGASGSGKSTLLRCVNLLEPIDAGRIVVAGEEITAPGVDVNRIRRRIGIVFQAFNLFPHMSVLDNVTWRPARSCASRRPRRRTVRWRSWSASALPTSGPSSRTGSRAASSNGWRSSGRSRWSRSSCSSTR
jgi:ABC-type phosphate transport system ATPase subunit